jgi:hypothetical protein
MARGGCVLCDSLIPVDYALRIKAFCTSSATPWRANIVETEAGKGGFRSGLLLHRRRNAFVCATQTWCCACRLKVQTLWGLYFNEGVGLKLWIYIVWLLDWYHIRKIPKVLSWVFITLLWRYDIWNRICSWPFTVA